VERVEVVLGMSVVTDESAQLDVLEKLVAWMHATLQEHVTEGVYADYDAYRKRYPT
jgi:hypothetical protein